MQAFANVATPPVQKTAQGSGKIYWEFRAAESAKNEEKAAATWYTVRVFQGEDPGFVKGDFVRMVGKLKLDVFMGREGKPMGVLVVMCYEAKKYDKTKSVQPRAAIEAAASDAPTPVLSIEASPAKSAVSAALNSMTETAKEADLDWPILV